MQPPLTTRRYKVLVTSVVVVDVEEREDEIEHDAAIYKTAKAKVARDGVYVETSLILCAWVET